MPPWQASVAIASKCGNSDTHAVTHCVLSVVPVLAVAN